MPRSWTRPATATAASLEHDERVVLGDGQGSFEISVYGQSDFQLGATEWITAHIGRPPEVLDQLGTYESVEVLLGLNVGTSSPSEAVPLGCEEDQVVDELPARP